MFDAFIKSRLVPICNSFYQEKKKKKKKNNTEDFKLISHF